MTYSPRKEIVQCIEYTLLLKPLLYSITLLHKAGAFFYVRSLSPWTRTYCPSYNTKERTLHGPSCSTLLLPPLGPLFISAHIFIDRSCQRQIKPCASIFHFIISMIADFTPSARLGQASLIFANSVCSMIIRAKSRQVFRQVAPAVLVTLFILLTYESPQSYNRLDACRKQQKSRPAVPETARLGR